MKMMDINKKFTEKVAEYLVAGYILNTKTMSGHQGELAKIDLVKDDKFIRIWMDEESISPKFYDNRAVVLRVSEYNDFKPWMETVWFKDLVHVEEINFYKVDYDWFIEDKEEYVEMKEKHYQRLRERSFKFYADDKIIDAPEAKEACANYLKRKVGYYRVRINEITLRKSRDNKYYISYFGKRYYLN